MATLKSTRAPVRGISPLAGDAVADLDNKLGQLRSLLMCMYGVGAEWFEVIGKGHRDTLLWLASDLAEECERLRVAALEG